MISHRTKIFRSVLPQAVQTATANQVGLADSRTQGPHSFIREAKATDLQFILHLSNRFRNQLGFLPKAALEYYASHSLAKIGEENDDSAGYLLGRASMRWNRQVRPITHAAVDMSAQRRHLGLALVQALALEASASGKTALQAMCRADLEANDFWLAAGFERIAEYAPGNARKQPMICWRKKLIEKVPQWFYELPPVAGWKARRTDARVPLPSTR